MAAGIRRAVPNAVIDLCPIADGGEGMLSAFTTALPGQIHQVIVDGPLGDVTAFVTLEPCAFHQRTPSCAKELIRRGVGRVVVAMLDPHPKNRGRGVEMLRDAGVEVTTGVLEAEARADLAMLVGQGGDPAELDPE